MEYIISICKLVSRQRTIRSFFPRKSPIHTDHPGWQFKHLHIFCFFTRLQKIGANNGIWDRKKKFLLLNDFLIVFLVSKIKNCPFDRDNSTTKFIIISITPKFIFHSTKFEFIYFNSHPHYIRNYWCSQKRAYHRQKFFFFYLFFSFYQSWSVDIGIM